MSLRKIEYYVATSVDGFISGPDGDISGFAKQAQSAGIDQYKKDLLTYDTVIMGRKTYEFGYQYGLEAGALAYPHMKHYVFSNNLRLDNKHEDLHICELDLNIIDQLKADKGSNIYLCGGSEFAAWLLEAEKIDFLKIKLNPFIQGQGIKLFNNTNKYYQLKLVNQETYEDGLMIITYAVSYNK